MEVYLRLGEQLPQEPQKLLARTKQPFEGMVYYFSMIDPDNRLCEHFFAFHVIYSQDEETLIIPRCGHVRSIGI